MRTQQPLVLCSSLSQAPPAWGHAQRNTLYNMDQSPWEILIWIAATEIRGRWCPWEILFTANYGMDPTEKRMWHHTREITPWFLPRKSGRQRTSVPRNEWSNGRNAGNISDSNPGKENSATERKPEAEIGLNKQKELKEQQMECSRLECHLKSSRTRRRRRFQPIK